MLYYIITLFFSYNILANNNMVQRSDLPIYNIIILYNNKLFIKRVIYYILFLNYIVYDIITDIISKL